MHDLVGEPFVVPSKRIRPFAYDLVMAYFESVGAVPNVTIEATEKPAMMSAVAAGLGMALAPDWVSRLSFPGVTMRRLRGALLDPPPPGALVGIAWRPQQKLAGARRFPGDPARKRHPDRRTPCPALHHSRNEAETNGPHRRVASRRSLMSLNQIEQAQGLRIRSSQDLAGRAVHDPAGRGGLRAVASDLPIGHAAPDRAGHAAEDPSR